MTYNFCIKLLKFHKRILYYNKENKMKVVNVTKEYFETENGERHYHPVPLEVVPTLEEFQKMYDKAEKFFKEEDTLG